ncbi:uncharacterized protein LOC143240749 [Tachypleus tridentatus]|uniref:uncharacterized protein LOC143240749 n=1 Tax=Tachypleus tridentatus TaxID=6853 RepID=UPI003FD0321B
MAAFSSGRHDRVGSFRNDMPPSLCQDKSAEELLQRTVVVKRDEYGYGLTVSGHHPVFVQSLKEDGAAAKVGIQEGDRIIKVNGTVVTDANHNEVVELIRSGTQVSLTLLRTPYGQNNRWSSGSQLENSFFHEMSLSSERITGPQPVDARKRHQLNKGKIHTIKKMLDKEVRYLEGLRKKNSKNSSDKLRKEIEGTTKRVKVLEDQLFQLTSGSYESGPSSSHSPPSVRKSANRVSAPVLLTSEQSGATAPHVFNDSVRSEFVPTLSCSQNKWHQKDSNLGKSALRLSLLSSSLENITRPTNLKGSRQKIDIFKPAYGLSRTYSEVSHYPFGRKSHTLHHLPQSVKGLSYSHNESSTDSPKVTPPATPLTTDSGSIEIMESVGNEDVDREEYGTPPDIPHGFLGLHSSQYCITSVEDEDWPSDSEVGLLQNHGPFNAMWKLLRHPAHLAIFMHFLITSSEPASLFFYLITNIYQEGTAKEMKKWAYEIHSTFLLHNAPLKVKYDDETILHEIDYALQNHLEKEDVLRNLFAKAKQKAKEELNELLAEFRTKRTQSCRNSFGPSNSELEKAMQDKTKELKIIEQVLVPILEKYSEDLEKADDKTSALVAALATVLKQFGVKSQQAVNLIERCPIFVAKEKKLWFLQRNKKAISVLHHNFLPQHYYCMTSCSHCQAVIWGVGNQGYQCQNCEMNIHKSCVKLVEEKCVGTFPNKKDKSRNRMSGIMENIIGKNRKQVEQSKECNLQTDSGLSYLYGASSETQINEGINTTLLSRSDQSLSQSEEVSDDSKIYANKDSDIQGVSDDSKIYTSKDSDIQGVSDDSKIYTSKDSDIQGVSDDSKMYTIKDSNIQEGISDDSKSSNTNSGSSIQDLAENSELRGTAEHYNRRHWPQWTEFSVGRHNVKLISPRVAPHMFFVSVVNEIISVHRGGLIKREYKTPLRKGSDSNIPRSQSDVEVDDKTISSLHKAGGSPVSSLSTRSLDSSNNSLEVMQSTTESTPVHFGSSTGRLQSTFSSSSSSLSHLLQLDDSDLEAENEPPKWQENVNNNVIRNLKPKEKKRQDVINELFHTERTHVRNLKILDRLFFKPLQQEKLLQQDLLDFLFPNLEELLKIHSRFNSIMKTRRQEQPVIQDIGDIMLKMLDGPSGEELKSKAAVFCHNQSFALKLLKSKQKKDQKLAQFLSDTEAKPLCRRLQLKDIIATGFQRLTKYPLLLENVAKYTSQKSEEHGKLQRAVDCSKQILAHVNQAVKEAENKHRLSELQKKIDKTAFEKVEASIVHSYRHLDLTKHKLIQEGPLIWRLHKQKTIEMHVVLLEEILLLLQKQDDKLQLKFHNNNLTSGREDTKVTHSPVLRVQNLFTRNVATDSKAFFIVSTSEQHAIYEFVASSTSERKKWLRCITEAVEAQKAKSKDSSSLTDEYLQKNKLMSVSLESSHSTSSIGVESTETEEPGDDVSLGAFSLSQTEVSSLNHSTTDDLAHDLTPSLSSQSKDTCSSCSSFEKIELFNVSTESQLINPLEIEVSEGPVVETAECVMTPAEPVTSKDEEIAKGSREEEDLVSDIFQVPIEEMEHVAETVKEFEGEKRMKELILASIYQANQLTALVREVLKVSDDERSRVCSKEENVIAHSETSAGVAMKSFVPSERLMNISNALNKNLTQLLSFVTEKDEEQIHLLEKCGSSREQLHSSETHQPCHNTASVSTDNLIDSQSRPNSYISVSSSLSEDLSDLLNYSDDKPETIKEVDTDEVHDIEEESEDKNTEEMDLEQEWKDREEYITNKTDNDEENNVDEHCVHNTERGCIEDVTLNVKERDLWEKELKENYKTQEEHESNLGNLGEEEENHNEGEMNENFVQNVDHMIEENKQGGKNVNFENELDNINKEQDIESIQNFDNRLDIMNEGGEQDDRRLNENILIGLDNINNEEGQDNEELNENTEEELDKMNEKDDDKGSSENLEKRLDNMNEDGDKEQVNKGLNENILRELDNNEEDKISRENLENILENINEDADKEQDNKGLNENILIELDNNEDKRSRENLENIENINEDGDKEQDNKGLNENILIELDNNEEDKRSRENLENILENINEDGDKEQDNKGLNENILIELDNNEEDKRSRENLENILENINEDGDKERDNKGLNENILIELNNINKEEQSNGELNENIEKRLDNMNEDGEQDKKLLNESNLIGLDNITKEGQDNKEFNENTEEGLDNMNEDKGSSENFEKRLDNMNENGDGGQDDKWLNENILMGLDNINKEEEQNKELNTNTKKELDKMNERQGNIELNANFEMELDRMNEEESNKELNDNGKKGMYINDKKEESSKEINEILKNELDKMNEEEQVNKTLNENLEKGLEMVKKGEQNNKKLNENFEKEIDKMNEEQQINMVLKDNIGKRLVGMDQNEQGSKEFNENSKKELDMINKEEEGNTELNKIRKGLDNMDKEQEKELNQSLETKLGKKKIKEQDIKEVNISLENICDSTYKEEQHKELNENIENGSNSMKKEEQDNQELNENFKKGSDSLNKEEQDNQELNENFKKGSDSLNQEEQDNQELNENFKKRSDSLNQEEQDNQELNENFEKRSDNLNKEEQDNQELNENFEKGPDNLKKEEQDNQELNENFEKGPDNLKKEEQENQELNENLKKEKQDNQELNENFEKGPDNLKKEEQDNQELNENFGKGPYNLKKEEQDNQELNENFEKGSDNLKKEKQDNQELNENFGKGSDNLKKEEQDNQELNENFEKGSDNLKKEEQVIQELNENFEEGSDNLKKEEQDNQELNENFEEGSDNLKKEEQVIQELNENFEEGSDNLKKEEQDNQELNENFEEDQTT